jgi:hypothetical protein
MTKIAMRADTLPNRALNLRDRSDAAATQVQRQNVQHP